MKNILLLILIGLALSLSAAGARQPACPPRCVTPRPFTPVATLVRPTATPRPTKTPTLPAAPPPRQVYLPLVFRP